MGFISVSTESIYRMLSHFASYHDPTSLGAQFLLHSKHGWLLKPFLVPSLPIGIVAFNNMFYFAPAPTNILSLRFRNQRKNGYKWSDFQWCPCSSNPCVWLKYNNKNQKINTRANKAEAKENYDKYWKLWPF